MKYCYYCEHPIIDDKDVVLITVAGQLKFFHFWCRKRWESEQEKPQIKEEDFG